MTPSWSVVLPIEGTLSLFLALVLMSSAGYKFMSPERSARAAGMLLGRSSSSKPVAMFAAVVEALFCLGMVIPQTRVPAALCSMGLWLLYALMLHRVAKSGGSAFDCGCSFSRKSGGSDAQRFIALGLAALAAVVALMPVHVRPDMTALLGAFGFYALYIAVGELVPTREALETAR